MFNFKKFILLSSLVMVFMFNVNCAKADTIVIVDLNAVVNNYSKAQNLESNIKTKEADLKKFVEEAQAKIKNAETKEEKEKIDIKLTDEFNKRNKKFVQYKEKNLKAIRKEVRGVIKQVAKEKQATMVLNKNSVIMGGVDISKEVISILKKKK